MPDIRLDEPPLGRRGEKVSLKFCGKTLMGYSSEPVSVALYASGFKSISRSMKLYRSRGFYCLHPQARTLWVKVDGEPVNPSEVLCRDGMEVVCSRPIPFSVRLAAPLLDAAFQHKGIVRSRILWPLVVEGVKRLSNHPELSETERKGREVREVKADLVVAGGGVAGLSAAITARKFGLDVLLIDDGTVLGGRMRYDLLPPPGMEEPGHKAVERLEEARKLGVKFLEKTTFTGFFEDAATAYSETAGAFYVLKARGYVIATGAVDLPCIFRNNDLPGVMAASTALKMANEYGILPGKRGVIMGATEYGVRVAAQLQRLGVDVTILDRSGALNVWEAYGRPGRLLEGVEEVEAIGKNEVREVKVLMGSGEERIEAEFVACAALLNPDLKLVGQLRAKVSYFDGVGFIPLHSQYMEVKDKVWVAGAASGAPYGFLHVLEGEIAGLSAALALGAWDAESIREEKVKEYQKRLVELGAEWKKEVFDAYEKGEAPGTRMERVPTLYLRKPTKDAFICICEDIHAEDLYKIVEEKGFTVLEKVKRGIGLCTGRCQGRLCMVNASLYVAHLSQEDPNWVGLIRMRPPTISIPLSAVTRDESR